MSETTGTVDFVVGGETFQTWYKVLGDLQSGIRPLVLLHGGPGIPHQGLLGHDQLYKAHSIPLVWYDQLGCGASTHLPDKPKGFWKAELFVDELENLVTRLGIADDFAILGHSWGGRLAAQFAASRQPKGLKQIVITNSAAAMVLWEKSAAQLLLQMPQDLQDVINKHQRDDTLEDPEYKAAMQQYYARFVCRLSPWPEAVAISHREMAKDPTVYKTLNGPNEFVVTGPMKDWNIIPHLHKITQPTLVMNARYDMAQDIAVMPFFQRLPRVKWVKFSESSHMPYWEEPDFYYEVVGQFLTAAE